jgi:hypothetical protein
MSMKKLFKISHPKGQAYLKKVGVECYHPNKQEAKAQRNELNANSNLDNRFFVSIGPDHWRYKS